MASLAQIDTAVVQGAADDDTVDAIGRLRSGGAHIVQGGDAAGGDHFQPRRPRELACRCTVYAAKQPIAIDIRVNDSFNAQRAHLQGQCFRRYAGAALPAMRAHFARRGRQCPRRFYQRRNAARDRRSCLDLLSPPCRERPWKRRCPGRGRYPPSCAAHRQTAPSRPAETMAGSAFQLAEPPSSNAPSRLTTCSHSAPAPTHCSAVCQGSCPKVVCRLGSPLLQAHDGSAS